MKIYHGSKHKFDLFDGSKIGTNGTLEGKGFYFTDEIRIAKGYAQDGYLYTAEFKGKKQLSGDKITIKKKELKNFLLELDKEMDYLSNWGEVAYTGIESLLEEAINGETSGVDNDIDLISSICNASGSTGRTLEILYEKLGYDSIITKGDWGGDQTIYIALVNEAVELLEIEKI
jgi:hypothetical protein